MNFVLDTNAVSETRKPRPNPGLLDWLSAQDPAHLFITTLTLAARDATPFERMDCKVINPWK